MSPCVRVLLLISTACIDNRLKVKANLVTYLIITSDVFSGIEKVTASRT